MTTKTYKAAKGARFGDRKAQVYGEELERLQGAYGGQLTSTQIVSEASADESPLHDFFEWDDDAAAEKYRMWQARHLMGSVKVLVEITQNEQSEVRAFVNVTIPSDVVEQQQEGDGKEDKGQRVYVPIERALSEEKLKAQVIEKALEELIGWQARYSQYKELATIFEAIDNAHQDLTVYIQENGGDREKVYGDSKG